MFVDTSSPTQAEDSRTPTLASIDAESITNAFQLSTKGYAEKHRDKGRHQLVDMAGRLDDIGLWRSVSEHLAENGTDLRRTVLERFIKTCPRNVFKEFASICPLNTLEQMERMFSSTPYPGSNIEQKLGDIAMLKFSRSPPPFLLIICRPWEKSAQVPAKR